MCWYSRSSWLLEQLWFLEFISGRCQQLTRLTCESTGCFFMGWFLMNAACAQAAALKRKNSGFEFWWTGPGSFLSNNKVCHCFLMDRNIIRLVVLSDKDSTSLYESAEHRWSCSGLTKSPIKFFFSFLIFWISWSYLLLFSKTPALILIWQAWQRTVISPVWFCRQYIY